MSKAFYKFAEKFFSLGVARSTDAPKPEPKREERKLELFASDDLMTRAEKIVSLFVSGATGGYDVAVYRILQAYEKLDQAPKTAPSDDTP